MTDTPDKRLALLEGRAAALQFLLGKTIQALPVVEKIAILSEIADQIADNLERDSDYAEGMLGVFQELRRQVDV